MNKLSERAILVRVQECMNGVFNFDNKARDYFAKSTNAEKEAFSVTKRKWPELALKGMRKEISSMRNLHRKMTLPWNDVGYRLLPNDKFFEFTSETVAIKDRFYAERALFKMNFDEYVTMGIHNQGDFADPGAYPKTSDEVDNLFDLNVLLRPCPDSDDIRVDLPEDMLEDLKISINKQIEEDVYLAIKELWLRFYKSINHMVSRLNTGDPKHFHASLLDNIEDIIKIIPSYNLNNDKDLEESRKEIEEVISKIKSIDDLKDDERLRRNTVDQLSKLMNKFPEVE